MLQTGRDRKPAPARSNSNADGCTGRVLISLTSTFILAKAVDAAGSALFQQPLSAASLAFDARLVGADDFVATAVSFDLTTFSLGFAAGSLGFAAPALALVGLTNNKLYVVPDSLQEQITLNPGGLGLAVQHLQIWSFGDHCCSVAEP